MLPHVTNRRSIFPQFFTDKPVDRGVVSALLDAANQAPSHRKTEPWRFRVYSGAGKSRLLKTMEEVYNAARPQVPWDDKLAKKFGTKVQQSPVVLAIFLHRDPAESVPEWEEIAAVGCAVQNLWTSLASFNLGGYWSSPGFLCGDYGQWPGAADNERCLGLFYLGYYDAPELPRPRGDWREKVSWITE
ncbi:MAG: nitroreductase [Bacteroidota bacterium]